LRICEYTKYIVYQTRKGHRFLFFFKTSGSASHIAEALPSPLDLSRIG
jgi:hypothetical protein